MTWVLWTVKVTVILIGLGLLLEIASRFAGCKTPPAGDMSLFSEYQPTKLSRALLMSLKERRAKGENISRDDYRKVFEELIVEVDPTRMGSWFGVVEKVGADIGFVRNNLPPAIKLLVKRHELEHMLQTGKERNREWSANLAVFKEYPLESLQMPVFALKDRVKFYRGQPICLVINLWNTFKKYLLPF